MGDTTKTMELEIPNWEAPVTRAPLPNEEQGINPILPPVVGAIPETLQDPEADTVPLFV